MTKLPIDLSLKSVTTKVSHNAWARAQALKEKYNARLSDVFSACLLHMDETKLEEVLQKQAAALDDLPKYAKGLMRNLDKLSDAERELLRDLLK